MTCITICVNSMAVVISLSDGHAAGPSAKTANITPKEAITLVPSNRGTCQRRSKPVHPPHMIPAATNRPVPTSQLLCAPVVSTPTSTESPPQRSDLAAAPKIARIQNL